MATVTNAGFSFLASTDVPPIANAARWKVSYHSTSASASVSANTIGGGTPFTVSATPTLAVFDTTDYAINTTVTTQSIGAVTVPYTGTYAVSGRIHWSTVCGSANQFMMGLTLNTSGTYTWLALGTEVSGTNLHGVAFSAVVALTAGQLIQPGYELSGSNTALGDATGSYTYFAGSLLTRTA
jgi:hypothetical protein